MSARPARKGWALVLVLGLALATWLLLAPQPTDPTDGAGGFDKLAHVGMFACLGVAAALAFPETPRWRLVAALLLYGALVELAQPTFGRQRDALDLAADALGAAAAWLVPRRPPGR